MSRWPQILLFMTLGLSGCEEIHPKKRAEKKLFLRALDYAQAYPGSTSCVRIQDPKSPSAKLCVRFVPKKKRRP